MSNCTTHNRPKVVPDWSGDQAGETAPAVCNVCEFEKRLEARRAAKEAERVSVPEHV